mgnify:CR=1 FL=1
MQNQKSKIKKIIPAVFILTAVFFMFNVTAVRAVSPTLAPSKAVIATVSANVSEKISNQINQLKDKIASRVSELNLVEKRGIIGTVTDTTSSKITIVDNTNTTKQVDVDEITKFSSSTTKGTFGLSDITKGTKVSVLGLYNKQTKKILARFVRTSVDPVFITGAISETDPKNIMLTLKNADNKAIKIDVVPSTKILSYSKDAAASKVLFLGLSIGDRVVVIGYPDKKDSNLVVATRIVILPDLPKDPKIDITIPSPTATPTTAVLPVKKLPITTPSVTKPIVTTPAPTVAR